MEKVKSIHCLTDIVAGYSAVLKAIDAVLSKSQKKASVISSIHHAIMTEVYNYFVGSTELYNTYIFGSSGHEAHTAALIEVNFFTKNPKAEAPDARKRLSDARNMIAAELGLYRKHLLELVNEL